MKLGFCCGRGLSWEPGNKARACHGNLGMRLGSCHGNLGMELGSYHRNLGMRLGSCHRNLGTRLGSKSHVLIIQGLLIPSQHRSSHCMCVSSRSLTYIEVNNFPEERMIYDVIATIYGTVEPGNATPVDHILAL